MGGSEDSKSHKSVGNLRLAITGQIPGFIEQGIMVGPETRSSCPIRILRNENYESVNTKRLYPMGEGAGYGGGIMSCALDGIRVANTLLLKHGKISERL